MTLSPATCDVGNEKKAASTAGCASATERQAPDRRDISGRVRCVHSPMRGSRVR
jgi:hypothetical protein